MFQSVWNLYKNEQLQAVSVMKSLQLLLVAPHSSLAAGSLLLTTCSCGEHALLQPITIQRNHLTSTVAHVKIVAIELINRPCTLLFVCCRCFTAFVCTYRSSPVTTAGASKGVVKPYSGQYPSICFCILACSPGYYVFCDWGSTTPRGQMHCVGTFVM